MRRTRRDGFEPRTPHNLPGQPVLGEALHNEPNLVSDVQIPFNTPFTTPTQQPQPTAGLSPAYGRIVWFERRGKSHARRNTDDDSYTPDDDISAANDGKYDSQ